MKRSTDRTRYWPTWAGTEQDVRRLGDVAAQLTDSRLKARAAEFDEETELLTDSVDSFIRSVTNAGSAMESDTVLLGEEQKIQDQVYKESRKQEREKLFAKFQTVMTLVHGNDTTTGPIDNVIREIDRRSLVSVKFSAGEDSESIEVTLTRQSAAFGAQLHVVSSDIGWANEVCGRISEEIEKGKPKSSWLRGSWGRMLASLTTPTSAILAVLTILLSKLPAADRADEIGIAIFACLGLFMIFFLFDRFHNWLMPRFEIFVDGSSSIGTRHLMWVGGQIAPLVIAIIATHLGLYQGRLASSTGT